MCGICGFAYADREHPVSEAVLDAMMEAIEHRGPDAGGARLGPGLALGHRRLRVIDPCGGVQPMSDADDLAVLTYNGEIYNFRALRSDLESAGWRFRTNSDTEVLLAGYLTWGLKVLQRLEGMFAFALWDRRQERLILARDRLGVKPLYWAQLAGAGLGFASELTSLIEHPGVERRVDRDALAKYLAFGHVSGDASMLVGVERLSPGTYLTWDRASGAIERGVYWDMSAAWREAQQRPAPSLEEFQACLEDAVLKRLVSDVPLGAFLSGGLDSSTVVALMRQQPRSVVETFSIGFDEATFDESPWARRAASELGCNHHEQRSEVRSPELLMEVADRLDEPVADTSIIPTYALSKMARQQITVALSGDGGDELLAGYVTHRADRYYRFARVFGGLPVKLGLRLMRLFSDGRGKVNVRFKARQFLESVALDPVAAHASWRKLASVPLLTELTGNRESGERIFEPYHTAYGDSAGLNPLDRMLYVDYKTWLLDDILVKVDRASMAHGLEVRSPFLDHRLLELCAGLPAEKKLGALHGKVMLREAARGLVPDFVLRRPKRGFNAPVASWIDGPWRDLFDQTIKSPDSAWSSILRPETVRRLLDQHRRGQRDHGHLLFSVFLLDRWMTRVGARG